MKKLKLLFPLLISSTLVAILFFRINFDELYWLLRNSNGLFLASSVFILIVAHIITAVRWQLILHMLGANVGLRKILYLYFANIPLAKIFPLYSGDFMRVYYLRDTISAARHAGGIFWGMFIDVAVLATLSLIGGILLSAQIAFFSGGTILVLMILLYAALPRISKYAPQRLRSHAENFLIAFQSFTKQKKFFALTLLLTVANWLLVLAFVQYVFSVFGTGVPLAVIAAFQPLVTLTSLIPITIWGIGLRESAMIVLFSGFAGKAVILATGFFYSFVGGIFIPLLCLPFTYRAIKGLKIFRK